MELIRPDCNYNFVGNRKYAYLFSAICITIALLSIPIMGAVKLGVDFSGGIIVQVMFADKVPTEAIRETLAPLSESLVVQKFASGGTGGEEFVIRTDATEEGSEQITNKIKGLLETKVGQGKVEIRGVEMVGPKVGKDLRDAAIWATVIALILLLAYVSFRFSLSMAVGAVFCLVHDILIVYGIFAWTGREFNLTILAAILTVIGYDTNDSIVVMDRIRENLPIMRKKPLAEILNTSINQTLGRTILTGSLTLVVLVALLIFGTSVLKDFAWALIAGILFGTYSSIFVVVPLVLIWDRFMPLKRM